ncbi:siderophore-interacting protein [Gordonia sp. VNK21]|uniref:siderophore-interacting protein n=1 Tax=Gordonia sp. VNK21 TaxID=3382483 RepID=UPI0038D48AC7
MPALLFTATEVQDVTPHMRRITFTGEPVAQYIATGQFPNIKILLPKADGSFDVPELDDPACGADTLVRTRPDLHERVRTYTVRRYDAQQQTLDIDFVLHGDEGIAGRWAAAAVAGSTLGAVGGGGRPIGTGERYLIAGDETGLPGVGNILENLPADAVGTAYIEVDGPAEQQDLQAPAGVEIVWLSRDGAAGGTTTLLADAVAAHPLAPGTFAWVSAEGSQVITIRKDLRARGVDRKAMLAIGYWRRGLTENGYAKKANHDRDLKEFDDHDHDHDHGVRGLAARLRRRG